MTEAPQWDKHDTCSESVFDQHGYYQTTLKLKKIVNLLQVLADQEIHPDGNLYGLNEIGGAILSCNGYEPESNATRWRNWVTVGCTRFILREQFGIELHPLPHASEGELFFPDQVPFLLMKRKGKRREPDLSLQL
ncbi:hypothetical protein H6P81_016162 [Aristolochia fimbriata]|uniref:Uncharacterized protein n=1 Tax=Aristolochia fimbriata TaxID=158543 RepID=A0AAV7EBB6_ARIFI|nr:hypothetical protein H6P81_016162 [Aristolochia fimbriata]